MSTDAKLKKIEELRVVDLRAELEKRGMDKAGNKAVLIGRLKKVRQGRRRAERGGVVAMMRGKASAWGSFQPFLGLF